eukprot:tig00000178_g12708.t1
MQKRASCRRREHRAQPRAPLPLGLVLVCAIASLIIGEAAIGALAARAPSPPAHPSTFIVEFTAEAARDAGARRRSLLEDAGGASAGADAGARPAAAAALVAAFQQRVREAEKPVAAPVGQGAKGGRVGARPDGPAAAAAPGSSSSSSPSKAEAGSSPGTFLEVLSVYELAMTGFAAGAARPAPTLPPAPPAPPDPPAPPRPAGPPAPPGPSAALTRAGAGRMSPDVLALAKADPSVAGVYENIALYAARSWTQHDAPWNLDRIDAAAAAAGLDGRYDYNATGCGVEVYVLDSGIEVGHEEFEGRASWSADFVQDSVDANGVSHDCNGHGSAPRPRPPRPLGAPFGRAADSAPRARADAGRTWRHRRRAHVRRCEEGVACAARRPPPLFPPAPPPRPRSPPALPALSSRSPPALPRSPSPPLPPRLTRRRGAPPPPPLLRPHPPRPSSRALSCTPPSPAPPSPSPAPPPPPPPPPRPSSPTPPSPTLLLPLPSLPPCSRPHFELDFRGSRGGRRAAVKAVKVLGCDGSGSLAAAIDGVEHVIETRDTGIPAIISMSLGAESRASLPAFDSVFSRATQAGIVVVVAAGNENNDACRFVPAASAFAITVGATGLNDVRAPFSNYGSCVNIFAPGVDIVSTSHTSTTAIRSLQGTSMATPLVSGVLATYLELHPMATVAEATQALYASAVLGAVGNSLTPPGQSRLLNIRSVWANPVNSIPASAIATCYGCSVACLNDGECLDGACLCADGFTGPRCETYAPFQISQPRAATEWELGRSTFRAQWTYAGRETRSTVALYLHPAAESSNAFDVLLAGAVANLRPSTRFLELAPSAALPPIAGGRYQLRVASADPFAVQSFSPTFTVGNCTAPPLNPCSRDMFSGSISASSLQRIQGAPAVFFTVSYHVSMLVEISTCSQRTNFDTVVSVTEGCPTFSSSDLIAQNDDSGATACPSNTLASKASFNLTAGRQYFVAVRGYGGSIGNFGLTVKAPNAACGIAAPTPAPTVEATPTPVPATAPGAGASCESQVSVETINTCTSALVRSNAGAGAPDVLSSPYTSGERYFKFNVTSTRIVTISTCSPSTDFDTVVYLYRGCPLLASGTLTPVAFSDDGCPVGLASSFVATVSPGYEYYVVVEGYGMRTGQFALSVQDSVCLGVPPPPTPTPVFYGLSLACQAAQSLVSACTAAGTGAAPPLSATTAGRTNLFATYYDSPEMLYTLSVPSARAVTVSLCHPATAFDTYVHIYRGCPANTSAVRVTFNDDGCGAAGLTPSLGSRVTFFAEAGVQYFVVVEGFLGNSGAFGISATDTACLPPPATPSPSPSPSASPSPTPPVVSTPPPVQRNPQNDVALPEHCEEQRVVGSCNTTQLVGSTVGAPSRLATSWCPSGEAFFRLSVPTARRLTVTTCSSLTNFDTLLFVFRFTAGAADSCPISSNATFFPAAAQLVASNDDACGPQSQLEFDAEAGALYLIAVEGYNAQEGTFALSIVDGSGCAEAGGSCNFATPIETCGSAIEGSNAGLPNRVPGSNPSGDVLYTLQPTRRGDITLSLCENLRYDTFLRVYGACPIGVAGGLSPIAVNDDGCGTLGSRLSFFANESQTYFVLVEGYSGRAGDFTLRVWDDTCIPVAPATPTPLPPPPVVMPTLPAVCANASMLAPCSSVNGSTVGLPAPLATGHASGQAFFRISIPTARSITFSLCSNRTNFDTVLRLYQGCPLTTGVAVESNDDTCGTASQLTRQLQPGVIYYVVVQGYGSSSGSFELSVSYSDAAGGCVTGGSAACDSAPVLPVCTSASGSNAGAPNYLPYFASGERFYRIPPLTTRRTVTLSTCFSATTFDSYVRVYRGCPTTSGVQIASDDDSCESPGLASIANAVLEPGVEHFAVVEGYSSSSGPFRLAALFADAPFCAANASDPDNAPFAAVCSSAPSISVCNAYSNSTFGAPNYFTQHPSGERYFKIRLQESRVVRFSLCNPDPYSNRPTNFDTVLRVIRGCPAQGGQQVAFSDNACGLQSVAAVPLDANVDYFIVVEGYGSASGDFRLDVGYADVAYGCAVGAVNVSQVCSQAPAIASCGTYAGSNVGQPSILPQFEVYYRFRTNTTGHFRFSTCSEATNFDTVIRIFSGGCPLLPSTTLSQVAYGDGGCPDMGFSQGATMLTAHLTAGTEYYVVVEGYYSSQGNFSLTINPDFYYGPFVSSLPGCPSVPLHPRCLAAPNITVCNATHGTNVGQPNLLRVPFTSSEVIYRLSIPMPELQNGGYPYYGRRVRLSLCSVNTTYPTSLAAYENCPLGPTAAYAYNIASPSNGCPYPLQGSEIFVWAYPERPVYVVVDGIGSAANGTFRLSASWAPTSPQEPTCPVAPGRLHPACAAAEPLEPCRTYRNKTAGRPNLLTMYPKGESLYRIKLPETRTMIFSLCNLETDFDTVLQLYRSCPLSLEDAEAGLTADASASSHSVAFDDQGCGDGAGRSIIMHTLNANVTYYLAVEGWQFGRNEGNFSLSVMYADGAASCLPVWGSQESPQCSSASVPRLEPCTTVRNSTVGRPSLSGAQGASGEFLYKFTVPESKRVLFSTCNPTTDYDSSLAVFQICPAASNLPVLPAYYASFVFGPARVAQSDYGCYDSDGRGRASVVADLRAGTTYWVVVGGNSWSYYAYRNEGNFSLSAITLTPPEAYPTASTCPAQSNPAPLPPVCAAAPVIEPCKTYLNSTVGRANVVALTGSSEFIYQISVPETRAVLFSLCDPRTTFDTVLRIYRGCPAASSPGAVTSESYHLPTSGSGYQVGSSDYGCTDSDNLGRSSTVVTLQGGVTYFVVIGGAYYYSYNVNGGSTYRDGNFALSVYLMAGPYSYSTTCPSSGVLPSVSSVCANAQELGTCGTYVNSTVGSPIQGSALTYSGTLYSGGPYLSGGVVFYKINVPTSRYVLFSLCDGRTDFDASIAIFRNCPGSSQDSYNGGGGVTSQSYYLQSSPYVVAANDYGCRDNDSLGRPAVYTRLEANTNYFVAISGGRYSGLHNEGSFALKVENMGRQLNYDLPEETCPNDASLEAAVGAQRIEPCNSYSGSTVGKPDRLSEIVGGGARAFNFTI